MRAVPWAAPRRPALPRRPKVKIVDARHVVNLTRQVLATHAAAFLLPQGVVQPLDVVRAQHPVAVHVDHPEPEPLRVPCAPILRPKRQLDEVILVELPVLGPVGVGKERVYALDDSLRIRREELVAEQLVQADVPVAIGVQPRVVHPGSVLPGD